VRQALHLDVSAAQIRQPVVVLLPDAGVVRENEFDFIATPYNPISCLIPLLACRRSSIYLLNRDGIHRLWWFGSKICIAEEPLRTYGLQIVLPRAICCAKERVDAVSIANRRWLDTGGAVPRNLCRDSKTYESGDSLVIALVLDTAAAENCSNLAATAQPPVPIRLCSYEPTIEDHGSLSRRQRHNLLPGNDDRQRYRRVRFGDNQAIEGHDTGHPHIGLRARGERLHYLVRGLDEHCRLRMRHTHRLHASRESAYGTCTVDVTVSSGRPIGTEGAIKNDHGASETLRIPAPNLCNQRPQRHPFSVDAISVGLRPLGKQCTALDGNAAGRSLLTPANVYAN